MDKCSWPCCFFYCYGSLPALHSFPTRRSSDLGDRGEELGVAPRVLLRRDAHEAEIADAIPLRSEEHTSELQSRFDLVCRLLLEKKKSLHSYRTKDLIFHRSALPQPPCFAVLQL